MYDAQVLIIDADDTLWATNVIFEGIIEAFLDWLAEPAAVRMSTRALLDEIEIANAARYGYGSKVFVRTLGECLERLRRQPLTAAQTRHIAALASPLTKRDVRPFAGVEETLAALARRHRLLLLTKGDAGEQAAKLEASRLKSYFQAVHIVPEKNARTYRDLVRRHRLSTELTWMIGDSPKSDILPAISSGLNAVLIESDHPWSGDYAELDASNHRVLRLKSFTQLLEHF